MRTDAKVDRLKEKIADYDKVLRFVSENDALAMIIVKAYRKRAVKRLKTLCETGS